MQYGGEADRCRTVCVQHQSTTPRSICFKNVGNVLVSLKIAAGITTVYQDWGGRLAFAAKDYIRLHRSLWLFLAWTRDGAGQINCCRLDHFDSRRRPVRLPAANLHAEDRN